MKIPPVVIVSVMICSFVDAAVAQTRCDTIHPIRSGDLVLAITGTPLQQDATINFVLSNRSKSTVYLKDARVDHGQLASLSSGERLGLSPSAIGIETTEGWTASSCLQNPGCWQPLSEYSVVGPKQELAFSLKYQGSQPQPSLPENAAVSFTVSLVTRFSSDPDSDRGERPNISRFNFSHIPLGC